MTWGLPEGNLSRSDSEVSAVMAATVILALLIGLVPGINFSPSASSSSSLRSMLEAKSFLRGTSTGRASDFPTQ